MGKRDKKRDKSKPAKQWEEQTFALPPQHGWNARPGYNVFVADRGALAFEFPATWVVIPTDDAIAMHDRKPPDDDVVLKVSVMRLPPIQGGWGGLPLEALVREVVRHDSRGATGGDDIRTVRRDDVDIAWTEVEFIDPKEKRPALSRTCLARARNIQPLITMDFWKDDFGKFAPVWDVIIQSLRVGVPFGDPRMPGDLMN